MYVYTCYSGPDVVGMVVDGAPVGPLGRLFIVPPDEVTEVPEEAGMQLIEHKAYQGVVRVETTKTKAGLEFNIEKAKADSESILLAEDEKRFQNFVSSTFEDRINRQKPVPPAPASIREIMARRGYKLEDYGIKPVGKAEAAANQQVADLQKQLDEMKALLSQALAAKEKPELVEAGKKGK